MKTPIDPMPGRWYYDWKRRKQAFLGPIIPGGIAFRKLFLILVYEYCKVGVCRGLNIFSLLLEGLQSLHAADSQTSISSTLHFVSQGIPRLKCYFLSIGGQPPSGI